MRPQVLPLPVVRSLPISFAMFASAGLLSKSEIYYYPHLNVKTPRTVVFPWAKMELRISAMRISAVMSTILV